MAPVNFVKIHIKLSVTLAKLSTIQHLKQNTSKQTVWPTKPINGARKHLQASRHELFKLSLRVLSIPSQNMQAVFHNLQTLLHNYSNPTYMTQKPRSTVTPTKHIASLLTNNKLIQPIIPVNNILNTQKTKSQGITECLPCTKYFIDYTYPTWTANHFKTNTENTKVYYT